MSKVGAEIIKFEKAAASSHQNRLRELARRRSSSNNSSRILGSMDSLVSADSDYSSGGALMLTAAATTGAPPLPPKGRYISSDNLVPPKLPPKKKVSISTSECHVIIADNEDSLSGKDSPTLSSSTSADSLATLPSVKELASKFMPKKSPEPMPRKSVVNKVRERTTLCQQCAL